MSYTYFALISKPPIAGDYLKNFIRLRYTKNGIYTWEEMINSSIIVNVRLISEGTYEIHTCSGTIYIAQMYRKTNTYFALVYDTPCVGDHLKQFIRLRYKNGIYTWEEMINSTTIEKVKFISEDNYEVHTRSGSVYIAQLHGMINHSMIVYQ